MTASGSVRGSVRGSGRGVDGGAPAGEANRAGSGLPPGYSRIAEASYEVVARDDLSLAVQELVSAHSSLYEWARGMPQARALRGRAPVYVGALPGHDVVVAVRHAWHGGMLAPLTRDRFRAPTRAGVELANALRLRALGIRTTDIVAYVLYDAGAGLRRYDVASRYLPDATDLGATLVGNDGSVSVSSALRSVVSLLSALAQHRVVHPDLNVKNILLDASNRQDSDSPRPGAAMAIVIDVDVVRFDVERDARSVMSTNVARLVRSMRKWKAEFNAAIGDATIERFERECRDAVG